LEVQIVESVLYDGSEMEIVVHGVRGAVSRKISTVENVQNMN
jgi:hypothetical protein